MTHHGTGKNHLVIKITSNQRNTKKTGEKNLQYLSELNSTVYEKCPKCSECAI